MACDPRFTADAEADLLALGSMPKRAAAAWIRGFARGQRSERPRPAWLGDAALRTVQMGGGMVLLYRPLRDDELAYLGLDEPCLLVVRVLPQRVLDDHREDLRRRFESADDDL